MARRYDFDWLRIGAVLLLFPYHTARIFDSVPHYYIKSNRSVVALDLFARFMEQWHMPLFFMLAGAASYYSLRRRSVRTFLGERLQRLFVPLLVGLLIIVPPMGYGAVRSRNADLSFWAYYPTFFQIDLAHLDGFLGTFTPAHLWFILFLLLFSSVSLPLLRSVNSGRGRKLVARLGARLSKRPYLIWLATLPLYLTRMTGLPYPNPLFFWLFFLYGYLMLVEPRLEKAMMRNTRAALFVGLTTMSLYLVLKATTASLDGYSLDDYTDRHLLYQLFLSINNLAWLMIVLNGGRRFLNHPRLGWRYLNHSAYPLYLLHQTILVGFAFWVLQWQIGTLEQFIWIVLLALGGTLLIYEVVVRHLTWVQVLLGVKL